MSQRQQVGDELTLRNSFLCLNLQRSTRLHELMQACEGAWRELRFGGETATARAESIDSSGADGEVQCSLMVSPSNFGLRNGFVGCIRALVLTGNCRTSGEEPRGGMYGVHAGCVGKCQSNPCLNNGTCHEGYAIYECDCRWTAFKGPICADEIGIKMLTDTMVKYEIPGTYKSTIAEKIRVGFTTTNPRGFLMGLYSNITGEYLTLAISNSGHLKVTFDFGFERHEKVYGKRTFHEGQNHDVKLYRTDSGRKLTMQVDNYEPITWTFDVKGSADAQFNNIQYVYIGKNESMAEGFTGCISRVEFDDIYPLKFYFQQDRPTTITAESRHCTRLPIVGANVSFAPNETTLINCLQSKQFRLLLNISSSVEQKRPVITTKTQPSASARSAP
ncbi:neurexin-4-like [Penaeus indicus]|uniref:neurexin-4-like n=1 Tax=Penaeus indicus TaxID=29960 RepID=UPI00300C57E0